MCYLYKWCISLIATHLHWNVGNAEYKHARVHKSAHRAMPTVVAESYNYLSSVCVCVCERTCAHCFIQPINNHVTFVIEQYMPHHVFTIYIYCHACCCPNCRLSGTHTFTPVIGRVNTLIQSHTRNFHTHTFASLHASARTADHRRFI